MKSYHKDIFLGASVHCELNDQISSWVWNRGWLPSFGKMK